MHVSACSFGVLEASDLALLVGYVALEEFNFIEARKLGIVEQTKLNMHTTYASTHSAVLDSKVCILNE